MPLDRSLIDPQTKWKASLEEFVLSPDERLVFANPDVSIAMVVKDAASFSVYHVVCVQLSG